MNDDYEKTMRCHEANCFQAHGFSKSGADQLAGHQTPAEPIDQAMLKAYVKPEWQAATTPAPGDPHDTNCWLPSKDDVDLAQKPATWADGTPMGMSAKQELLVKKIVW